MSTERQLPPVLEDGFDGMFANARATQPVGYVSIAQNFYLQDRVWKPRTGLKQIGFQLPGFVQATMHFQGMDGTQHTLVAASGNLYNYDWSTDSFTTVPSTPVIGMALLGWTVSRGRLIVTDGINSPWMWDPVTDTYTVLTNAPVAKHCTVYYDKVFFWGLTGIDSNVFEWSDEGDPVNGYSGDDQEWQFVQTDGGPIVSMVALNEALIVLKHDSVSRVVGAAEDDFQTDAVREGVNESEGTPAVSSAITIDGNVFWLSNLGPRVALGGIRFGNLNENEDGIDLLKDVWSDFTIRDIENALVFYDPIRRHIVWIVDQIALLYAIDERAFSKLVFRTNSNIRSVTRAEDHNGNDFVLIGDNTGYVYVYGDSTNATDAGNPIEYILESRDFGRSVGSVTKRIVEVMLVINAISTELEFTVSPKVDGKVRANASRRTGMSLTGRRMYRRGLNAVGYTVGWQFVCDQLGHRAEIEQAITSMTVSATHATHG